MPTAIRYGAIAREILTPPRNSHPTNFTQEQVGRTMARRPSMTDEEAAQQGIEVLKHSLTAEQDKLAKRNEFTTDAVIEDIRHIKSVINAKWSNPDIPMIIRNKWRDIANMVSSLASVVDRVKELESITTSPCYIIDANGKLRKATCTEIFSALDNTPDESV